jgi:coenzyme F420 hydrogenase subunit beta
LKYRVGEWPEGMTFYLKDGTMRGISKRHYNYLNILFLPYRCQFCVDFSSELADISFGDIWKRGILGRRDFKKSWSAIIASTKRGEQLINQVFKAGKIYLEKLKPESNKTSFSYNIKFKKQGIKIRSLFNPDPPCYVNESLIKNNFRSATYHLMHYLLFWDSQ